MAGEGRQALAEQRHAFAAERLAQALARWRGPVLEDLPLPAALQPEIERLDELRMMVLEDSIEARLGLAEPAALVAELASLTARYPLRERLWAHLMLALYHAGRQADALDAYQRIYRLLDQELGVQPGRALQRLHQQILAADPTLAAPPAAITHTPGRAHHALNQHEQARKHWRHALNILTDIGVDRTDDEETTTAAIRAHLASTEQVS